MLWAECNGRSTILVDAEGKETIRTWPLDKARMRIAARQWYAARTNPEQFSGKFSWENSGGHESLRGSVSLADFMTDEELATQRAILEAAEQRRLAAADLKAPQQSGAPC